ncbi:GLPGLI family protein [Pedobacter miscanthi]|uniref:GLPGLI family protein n=1 Tax=Pedobacter miscanthi TaxID=2259170 RepID=A0A366KRM1_9SPHI|nr:GLPGLI family protein [Pedobacter miscanthi]RBQ03794.1 hypothetical protein DRW42_20070 [Pedobacter miscanthi]
MIRLVSISILSFILIGSLQAQSKGTLNYKLITRAGITNTEVNHIVYFKGVKSLELGIPKKLIPITEKKSETEISEIVVVKSKKPSFVYKDLRLNKLIVSDFIISKQYIIADTLNNFKWKITSEHKKILGYTCTKANLNFRGRNYVVWFTEQVPLPLGPWKFGGLPGLIVKVTDSEVKFDYELTGINLKAKFDDKIIAVPVEYAKDKPITPVQFINLFKKKLSDIEKMSRTTTTFQGGRISNVTINLPEKQEKF